jgi:hypothetical protein
MVADSSVMATDARMLILFPAMVPILALPFSDGR